ncbi:hypothetical protein AKO1_001716 [Acrasis kona]|uniref:Uncharacterized protein n=1 Tax=Acrasis kona TaxID=1008807 RepID=A0AAW2Z8B8_9EUKA
MPTHLKLLISVLTEFKEIEDTIDRFNRAIDIIEWISHDERVRELVSDGSLNYAKQEVMSSSPEYCSSTIFEDRLMPDIQNVYIV